MLICVQCGDITQDPNFEYDNDTGDVFSLCPACGCYTLEDAFLCHGCHQWHPGEHQQDGFCPACAAAAATEWKRHNDAFFQGKPPKLRDLINTIMDGETL